MPGRSRALAWIARRGDDVCPEFAAAIAALCSHRQALLCSRTSAPVHRRLTLECVVHSVGAKQFGLWTSSPGPFARKIFRHSLFGLRTCNRWSSTLR